MRARTLRTDQGRWLTEEVTANDSSSYVYVGSCPLTWIDDSGAEQVLPRQRVGKGSWNWIVSTCLHQSGLDLVTKWLKRPACAAAIKQRCGKSFQQMAASIQWQVANKCLPSDPKACTGLGNPIGQPCKPTGICLNRDFCDGKRPDKRTSAGDVWPTPYSLADAVIYEMGNYCQCLKTRKDPNNEEWALEFREKCSPLGLKVPG